MVNRKTLVIFGLLAALSVSAYLWASSAQAGPGFPLDDAWIHQTYARNLATLGEWSFVPGQPSAGSTAPLWSLLLSAGHFFGLGPYLWTYLLGGLILWGFGLLTFWATQQVLPERPGWAWGAGIFIIFEWHLVWSAVSGMETILFAFFVTIILIILVVDSHSHPSSQFTWLLLGFLIGLSVWLRPEGISLLGPVLLGSYFGQGKGGVAPKKIMLVSLGFLLLFGPYLLLNNQLAGEWWPNTFYAKQAEYAILRDAPLLRRLVQQFSLPLIGAGVLLLPGFLIAAYRSLQRRHWGLVFSAVWVLGHLSLYALRLPVIYQHGRYAVPVMPIFFLISLFGMIETVKLSSPVLLPRLLSRIWVIASGALLFAFWFVGLNTYVQDVAIIESEMVQTAKWIAENTEPDELLAAHDIGALGYFTQRPILDLAGLVSPDVIPFIRDEAQLEQYVDHQGGQILMTFPNWYPQLIQDRQLIYQSTGELSIELGGENMAVYRWIKP